MVRLKYYSDSNSKIYIWIRENESGNCSTDEKVEAAKLNKSKNTFIQHRQFWMYKSKRFMKH